MGDLRKSGGGEYCIRRISGCISQRMQSREANPTLMNGFVQ
jgi:hypothetical protein